jgi:hypothetical protein
VHDRHQVLHQLLLRTERLCVEYHDLAAMRLAKMRQQFIPKTRQSIFMDNHQCRQFGTNDPIYHVREFGPFEIQAATDLCDHSVNTKLFERGSLVGQIWFLRRLETRRVAIVTCLVFNTQLSIWFNCSGV